MSVPTRDTSPNDVMNMVFDSVVFGRDCSRQDVQRELLNECNDDTEVRDLLVYLAVKKQLRMQQIICKIKQIDRSLALTLRRSETGRRASVPVALVPVFSAG